MGAHGFVKDDGSGEGFGWLAGTGRFDAGFDADSGDLADDVAAVIEDGGAAGTKRPVGADVHSYGGKERGAGFMRQAAFGELKVAVDDALAKIAVASNGVAEAIGWVTGGGVGGESERFEGAIFEAEDAGVAVTVGGQDFDDGKGFPGVIGGNEATFLQIARGFDDVVSRGDGTVTGEGVSAAEVDARGAVGGAEIEPADAHVSGAGLLPDFAGGQFVRRRLKQLQLAGAAVELLPDGFRSEGLAGIPHGLGGSDEFGLLMALWGFEIERYAGWLSSCDQARQQKGHGIRESFHGFKVCQRRDEYPLYGGKSSFTAPVTMGSPNSSMHTGQS